jgi:two-component system chemotaxis sensor kinase CheA
VTDSRPRPDDQNSLHADNELREYLQTFVDETDEQLDGLVDTMLALENDLANQDELNEAFRLIHSIKGSAGIMGFQGITALTHQLESRFERFRSGSESLSEDIMGLVLRAIDFLRECNQRLRKGQALGSPASLLEELQAIESKPAANSMVDSLRIPEENPAASPRKRSSPSANDETSGDAQSETLTKGLPTNSQVVTVSFEPKLQLIDLKAQLILKRLSTVGVVTRCQPNIDAIEESTGLDELKIWLQTETASEEIEKLVDVAGVQTITFGSTLPGPEQAHGMDNPLARDDQPITTDRGTANQPSAQLADPTEQEAEFTLSQHVPAVGHKDNQGTPQDSVRKPILPSAIGDQTPHGPDALSPVTAELEPKSNPRALSTTGRSANQPQAVAETMRVGIDRLDSLMNLTGELVVNRARFEQLANAVDPQVKTSKMSHRIREFRDTLQKLVSDLGSIAADPRQARHHIQQLGQGLELMNEQIRIFEDGRQWHAEIADAVDQLNQVSDNLQRGVLDTRMTSVSPLFNRFRRLVRDLAKERGKEVRLELSGEKTEMDKRLLDEMGDPLVHLIRNALDHGLETRDERIRLGKPAEGIIKLSAYQNGNNVFIEIRDDGRGIDHEKIRRKAAESEILSESEANRLSPEQANNLIWDPGFSTAEQVTDISGRGVGMDVVKVRIRELNGSIEVASTPGIGTRFLIRLPLTLAIINSLLVRICGETFTIPVDDVKEIVALDPAQVVSTFGVDSFEYRGSFIPLIRASDLYSFPGGSPSPDPPSNNRLDVVVAHSIGKLVGLRVDALMGTQDIVVKSLSDNLMPVEGLSGASILGNGRVSLMADVGALISKAISMTVPTR